jgi:hypothetical protein
MSLSICLLIESTQTNMKKEVNIIDIFSSNLLFSANVNMSDETFIIVKESIIINNEFKNR